MVNDNQGRCSFSSSAWKGWEIKFKVIMCGLLAFVFIITMVGFYALAASKQITKSFEGEDKQFRSIAVAASKNCYVKRAESHLMLYLALHREVDKQKFSKNVESLYEQISILDHRVKRSEARSTLDKIKSNAAEVLPLGNELIAFHDRAMENTDGFDIRKHQATVIKLYDAVSATDELALELQKFITKLEESPKLAAMAAANRIQYNILIVVMGGVALTLCLGYFLSNMVNNLKNSENKYRKIFENIQDVYYETRLDGTILEISPSIESVSHYTRKELIGKSAYDVHTHSEQRDELVRLLLDTGKINDFEISLTDKNGSRHPCSVNAVLIKDEQDNPIKLIGSLRDISERKQLEAQLQHARKMEAMGSLAGGIAHEFNNILGIIIPNAELAGDDVPDRSLARECLDEIRMAALRASEVVQQILGFACKFLTEPEPVSLIPILKDCLRLLRASIPATVEISQDSSCEVDTVFADPTQMSQVIMNLCINAAQAMGEHGGVLKVTLKNTEFENHVGGLDAKPGLYVELAVSDTGQGIPPEIIGRIFDPYFTTREIGEGTGMGLSLVHGIVKSCHGIITVHSEPGKGTVFEVLLPVCEAETKQNAREAEALPTGNETILCIDDEQSIVKVVKRMLERLGYQVETRTDPLEALELFRSGPDRFDLVITDLTMPKMTGESIAKKIRNIRADIPVILTTGYREKISIEKVREMGMSALVFKPFVPHDFALTVRNVLDGKS